MQAHRRTVPAGHGEASHWEGIGVGQPADNDATEGAAIPPESQVALLVYTAVPFPLCVVDQAGRLAAMNPAAERFWGVQAADVLGSDAREVLGAGPLHPGPRAVEPLEAAAAGGGERVPCRIRTRDGLTHAVSLVGARLQQGGYQVFAVVAEDAPPEWAYQDPLTGLANRLAWGRAQARWAARAGAVVMFDLDNLKEVNDRQGHRTGDRLLALVGEVLRAHTAADGMALRYGGDEFLVLLPEPDVAAARRFSDAVCAAAAARGQLAATRLHLSAGVAAFGPGGLAAAVQQADDGLYAAKGVLLRARSGARMVLTREGRRLLRTPEEPPRVGAAAFASRFTTAFDGAFREVLAGAVQQARRFVAFIDPEPGIAAVEVGAGSGRITLDGGLAHRIGPSGQLLVTDPSAAQLQVARQRLAAAGCAWVRFLAAEAESLPLASGCVDLVLGSTFLHFTDVPRAVAEMARVLRPGSILALSTPLPWSWPPFWAEALRPAAEEAARLGLPLHHPAVSEEVQRAALAAAGLQVERVAYADDCWSFPHAEVARTVLTQIQGVALMLRGAPAVRLQAAEDAVMEGIATLWDRFAPEERAVAFRHLHLLARKPGA
jgi:diguanylate cyclase (GGDEF)-like protein/PAS domain S-box-containing protein